MQLTFLMNLTIGFQFMTKMVRILLLECGSWTLEKKIAWAK